METGRLVDAALREEVAETSELVGVSCLADGADSLFAQAVLDHGGDLIAVVPSATYRDGLPEEHHPIYAALLARALEVVRLDHIESTEKSYMAGSLAMLDRADRLVAVWDGEPARGYGGTADVVQVARDRDLPVTRIWPNGATRD